MRSLPILTAPGPRTSPWSAALHVLVFVAGLAGLCEVVRGALLRDPEVGVEQSRLSLLLMRHFAPHKDEFDLVFVGSSRFQRGVDPEVFDARVASAADIEGELRSYNYSMVGMRMPEIIARVDWILAQEPRKLRWLIVELTSLDPAFRHDNRRGRRMISWHTPRATLDMLRVIAASARTPRAKLEAALPHLAEFVYRTTNVGLGPEALGRWTGAAPRGPRVAFFDGYESDDEEARRRRRGARREGADEEEPGTALGQTPAPAASAVDDARVGDAVGNDAQASDPDDSAYSESEDDFPDGQARVLAEFIERVGAAGVELIFVRPPRSPRDRTAVRAGRSGILPAFLRYDPEKPYLYLYDGALKRDKAHLNSAGATAFSNQLAADFLAYLAERERGRED